MTERKPPGRRLGVVAGWADPSGSRGRRLRQPRGGGQAPTRSRSGLRSGLVGEEARPPGGGVGAAAGSGAPAQGRDGAGANLEVTRPKAPRAGSASSTPTRSSRSGAGPWPGA